MTDAVMIDVVMTILDADVERLIADVIISGGKITKILTPTIPLTLKATTLNLSGRIFYLSLFLIKIFKTIVSSNYIKSLFTLIERKHQNFFLITRILIRIRNRSRF